MQFIRRYLVLKNFPIKYYARGHSRTEILVKLYEFLSDTTDEIESLCLSFIEKIYIIDDINKYLSKLGFSHNHLVYECLLWSLLILENEKFDLQQITKDDFIKHLSKVIMENTEKYTEIQAHYYSQIINRYTFTANIFEKWFNISLQIYIENTQIRDEFKNIKSDYDEDTKTKLGELESLRITKPDPSRTSIDDITRMMERNKFLVRPSYQRSEVINLSKASAIIESILLGINLPPIFIFKRLDGVSEVIDGQQRLLTILGFIGKEYIDEDNKRRTTKNPNFALKDLRILKQLDNKMFSELESTLQDKIYDFELFVVEIQQALNPHFNPIDLFVRLNDKPYPILENSFEMWNSWVDRDLITKIRDNVGKHRDWFHLRLPKNSNDRDRMENEELYTSLAYLEFRNSKEEDIKKYLYIYQQNNRINARIGSAKDITSVLTEASENQISKKNFLDSIKNIEKFISKLKLVLLDKDISDKNELKKYFATELDTLFKGKKETRGFRRTKQDFYILWYALNKINIQMVKFHRVEIKKHIQNIFFYMKSLDDMNYDNSGQEKFIELIHEFHQKYKKEERNIKLSDAEKEELIKQQDNRCPISGSLIFMGDEIEVDHDKPLAIGGTDSIENLQITHKIDNRSKGVNYPNKRTE